MFVLDDGFIRGDVFLVVELPASEHGVVATSKDFQQRVFFWISVNSMMIHYHEC